MRVGRVLSLGLLLSWSVGCQQRPAATPATPAPSSSYLTIRGIVTNEGVECPSVREASGLLYTLAGPIGNFRVGDRVCVKGKRVEISTCMQGITISVDWIGPASSCP